MWLGLLVAVIYGAVAVAANFVNKYAVQVLPLPTTILLAQTLTTVIILRLMATLQVIRLPQLRSIRVQQLAPLSMCYAVHAVLVLYSLAFLSVPMYNVLKRLTPVMVLVIKGVLDRKWPDAQTTSSVLLIVSGCLVAGAGDLSFDGQGYTLALFCAFMQATYILLAERATGGSGGQSTSRKKHHSSGVDLPDIEGKRADLGYGPDLDPKSTVAHSTGVEVHANFHLSSNGTSSRSLGSPSVAAAGNGAVLTADGSRVGPGSGGMQTDVSKWLSALSLATCFSRGSSATDPGGPSNATELLYSICVIALPALATVCVVTGEGARAPALLDKLRNEMGQTGFAVWLATTAVTEGLLTGSVILCTLMNSALTTSIVGVLKGAVSSVLGFFLLGGVKFHAVNVAGITMNMVGGIWYTAAQYVRQKSSGG